MDIAQKRLQLIIEILQLVQKFKRETEYNIEIEYKDNNLSSRIVSDIEIKEVNTID